MGTGGGEEGGGGALGDRAWKGSWMVSSYTPFPPVPVLPQLVALVTALSALRQCGAAETQPGEQETRQIHRGGDTGNRRMKTASRSGVGEGWEEESSSAVFSDGTVPGRKILGRTTSQLEASQ